MSHIPDSRCMRVEEPKWDTLCVTILFFLPLSSTCLSYSRARKTLFDLMILSTVSDSSLNNLSDAPQHPHPHSFISAGSVLLLVHDLKLSNMLSVLSACLSLQGVFISDTLKSDLPWLLCHFLLRDSVSQKKKNWWVGDAREVSVETSSASLSGTA